MGYLNLISSGILGIVLHFFFNFDPIVTSIIIYLNWIALELWDINKRLEAV